MLRDLDVVGIGIPTLVLTQKTVVAEPILVPLDLSDHRGRVADRTGELMTAARNPHDIMPVESDFRADRTLAVAPLLPVSRKCPDKGFVVGRN